MQEEIAKGALAVAKFVIYWIIWSIVLFHVGRATLLFVTLGRFPRGHDAARYVNEIAMVGVLVLFLTWLAIAIYNNTIGVQA